MLNLTSAQNLAAVFFRYCPDKKFLYSHRSIIIVGSFSFLIACSGSNPSSKPSSNPSLFAVSVPIVISNANLPEECFNSLSAFLTIDTNRTKEMNIVNGEWQVFFEDTATGEHEFIVKFQCILNAQSIDLAKSSKVLQFTNSQQSSPITGNPNIISFEPTDFQPLVDTDEDNVSNIRELELAENPLVYTPPKAPRITISTLEASVFFSSDIDHEYAASYNLLVYPDGGEVPVIVASNVPDAQFSLLYTGYKMLVDQYVLQACNTICTDSEKFTLHHNMLSQMAYVKAFNSGLEDFFGNVSISADGNTLAVGASFEDGGATGVHHLPANSDAANNNQPYAGAVYVYTRQNGRWIEQAYIKAFNSDFDDNFGTSIALSADGNIMAVGAGGEDGAATGVQLPTNSDQANAAIDSGAVYVYTRQNGFWVEDAYIKAFNTGANDHFGSVSISADGNTLAVSASIEGGAATGVHLPTDSDTVNAAGAAGAVYMYTRQNGIWVEDAYIKAFNTEASDYFGSYVAISANGNTLAVGSLSEDGAATGVHLPADSDTANTADAAGAVYVYTRQNGLWVEDAYIKGFNTEAIDNFGRVSISADGNTLAVGASREDGATTGVQLPTNSDIANAAPNAGAVYMYTRQSGSWVEDAYIKAFNTQADDNFGRVIISDDGNALAVGAPEEDGLMIGVHFPTDSDTANGTSGSGAVYMYTRENNIWTEKAYVKAFNTQKGDRFWNLDISADGSTLAVGAGNEDGAVTGVHVPANSDTANAQMETGAVYVY